MDEVLHEGEHSLQPGFAHGVTRTLLVNCVPHTSRRGRCSITELYITIDKNNHSTYGCDAYAFRLPVKCG